MAAPDERVRALSSSLSLHWLAEVLLLVLENWLLSRGHLACEKAYLSGNVFNEMLLDILMMMTDDNDPQENQSPSLAAAALA